MPQVLTDVNVYLGAADLTGASNHIEIGEEYEDLDKTVFGNTAKRRVAGLADVSASIQCFWEAGGTGKPDDLLWSIRGSNANALTVTPDGGTDGTLAYLMRVFSASHKPGGDVGKLVMAGAELSGNWPSARGKILHPNGTVRTSTGTGTARQLGAVAAGRAMYVCLHVLSVSADSGTPTIAVTLDSDDNSDFTSATTRVTFTTASAAGGQAMRVVGAITDDWWRVAWTIAGGATNPSFMFAVSAGIAKK